MRSVMDKYISKIRNSKYYLPLTIPVLTLLFAACGTSTARLAGIDREVNGGADKSRSARPSDPFDDVHEQRIKFAADHGVADPAALAASVRHSRMANLLISVAIEESLGDPVAVGSAGEQGAWQVIPSDWGTVPKDIHGQAGQAERIINGLLIYAKGNKKKALARYNGGPTPHGKSYRYAERILKRARHLQVAVNFIPKNYNKLRQALLDPPGNSRMLTSFFHSGISSNRAALSTYSIKQG